MELIAWTGIWFIAGITVGLLIGTISLRRLVAERKDRKQPHFYGSDWVWDVKAE